MSALRWPAIEAAQQRHAGTRVPFTIEGRRVGSVLHEHLDALRRWPAAMRIVANGVDCALPAGERDAALAEIHEELRAQGLIRAWRDETFLIVDPATLQPLARIERAAARFWGTLTFGAHCNGYVADDRGQPHSLWIAQRSFSKATDPGRFDNLVGGGVPAGQSPFEALVREGWEEAGLPPEVMRGAVPGRVIGLEHAIPEGYMQEHLHSFDLQLGTEQVPSNQDGEVHGFTLLPLADAIRLAEGDTMTVDASLVILDFALRRRLLPEPEPEAVAARAAALWVDRAG